MVTKIEELYIMLDNLTFSHANRNILSLTSDVCTQIFKHEMVFCGICIRNQSGAG